MKYVLIVLTFVSWLTPCSICYSAEPGEDLFFSLKASLWYQGVDQLKSMPDFQHKTGENTPQVSENKDILSSVSLPEELTVALKNL